MENKQTAVEWLIEQIEAHKIEIVYSDKIDSIKCLPPIVAQAKAMEKEQIAEAYRTGVEKDVYNNPLRTGKMYYNDTYGE